jgi:hypothetical protein
MPKKGKPKPVPYHALRTIPSPAAPTGTVLRPVVAVLARGSVGETRIAGRLDTGADETILPGWALTRIGHTGPKGQTGTIGGIAGQSISVVYGLVTLTCDAGLDEPFTW